jgi:hypothetical protein
MDGFFALIAELEPDLDFRELGFPDALGIPLAVV